MHNESELLSDDLFLVRDNIRGAIRDKRCQVHAE